MELHLEQLQQIVRHAEQHHGHPHLSLVQVLEAAALERHPASTHRDLHRSLLTLSLDPEQNWWKKLQRMGQGLRPRRSRHASVDHFSDVLRSSSSTGMRSKSVIAAPHVRSVSRGEKLAASRPPVAVVDSHPYETFRLLSTAFQHWTRYAVEARSRRLPPLQLRCLFRWLDTSLPTADPAVAGGTFASIALCKKVDVASKRMALLLHADATLLAWTLTRVWRAWLAKAEASLARKVQVQTKYFAARRLWARSYLRIWHMYATIAPKERSIAKRRAHCTAQLHWSAWREGRMFAAWSHYLVVVRNKRALRAKVHAFAAKKLKARIFEGWKQSIDTQIVATRCGLVHRCRRVLLRWRVFCDREKVAAAVRWRRVLCVYRERLGQWRRYVEAKRVKHARHRRCDGVANRARAHRAIGLWINLCQSGLFLRQIADRAHKHAAATTAAKAWVAWLSVVEKQRRLRFFRMTLPTAFASIYLRHWLTLWRVHATTSQTLQLVDVSRVHIVRKHRFWQCWKARAFHATVAAVFLRCQQTFITRQALGIWEAFAVSEPPPTLQCLANVLVVAPAIECDQYDCGSRLPSSFGTQVLALLAHCCSQLQQVLSLLAAHHNSTRRQCFQRWRNQTRRNKALDATYRELWGRTITTAMATRFGTWHRHTVLAPRLRACRQRVQQRSIEAVFIAWLQYTLLRRKCHSIMRMVEERWQSVSVLQAFQGWRAYLQRRRVRRSAMAKALGFWLTGQLDQRFQSWAQWLERRRQQHRVFDFWAQKQQRRAVAQWSAFATASSDFAEMVAQADVFRATMLGSAVLVAWRRWSSVASWRTNAIASAAQARQTRAAARVWQHWRLYCASRRTKHGEERAASLLYHAALLRSTFHKWTAISRVMKVAREALQATTLRLQVLLQLSCFRSGAGACAPTILDATETSFRRTPGVSKCARYGHFCGVGVTMPTQRPVVERHLSPTIALGSADVVSLQTKSFRHWKQYLLTCRTRICTAISFFAAAERRQILRLWHAWRVWTSHKKARLASMTSAIAWHIGYLERRTVYRWHDVAIDADAQRSMKATADKRFHARLLRCCFQGWYCHVENALLLQQHCTRVGQLIMRNIMQRLFSGWAQFTTESRARQEIRKLAESHRHAVVAHQLCSHWHAWAMRGRKQRRANRHFALGAMRQTMGLWKQFVLLAKIDRQCCGHYTRLASTCFRAWHRHQSAKIHRRRCYAVLVEKSALQHRYRVFRAWKRWTGVQAVAYEARVAYCEGFLRRVLDHWRHLVKIQHVAECVQNASTIVFGQLHVDLRKCWWAWHHVFLARHWRRRKVYTAVWSHWRQFADQHKHLRSTGVHIAAEANRRRRAAALLAWRSHVARTVQLRRALVTKRQREHLLTRYRRQRARHLRQLCFCSWRAVTREHREVYQQQRRQRDGFALARALAAWQGRVRVARRCRLQARHMTQWRLGQAVVQWCRHNAANVHLRVVNAAVAQWLRRERLRRLWPRWHRFAVQQRRTRAWTKQRTTQVGRDAVRRWQYNVHLFQVASKSRLYASLRLMASLFRRWRTHAAWLQARGAFARRVLRERWVRSYVRQWHLRTRSVSNVATANRYMETFRCRHALRVWRRRLTGVVQNRRATACHLRHLWHRWRTQALESRATWWHNDALRCKSFAGWQAVCVQEQAIRFHQMLQSKRVLRGVWKIWRWLLWRRQANAEARAFARFQRLHNAVVAWRCAMNLLADETTTKEAAADTFHMLQLQLQHLHRWRYTVARTQEQRRRHGKMVQAWQGRRVERLLAKVWGLWTRYHLQKKRLEQHLAVRNEAMARCLWTKWLNFDERRRLQRKHTQRAEALYHDIVLRKVLHHWHIYVTASSTQSHAMEEAW
ncbi:hypothetical protein ACHHYP_09473 [Achlya hypogyna]|uniref:Sfi1 spindle body domain-containing protein n=1 Tax=Achlya hypogyna TaxID=1202772 RepID=A0A1V9YN19_ACHHY|nr:hypothetical protein ACHHYP_09473 [Achlya hypogyna]